MTKRLSVTFAASLFSLALAVPAAAASSVGDVDRPGCGDDEDGKKDESKNPSVDQPSCGDDEDGKKDESKNPSLA